MNLIIQTFKIIEDAEWINILSKKINTKNPDILKLKKKLAIIIPTFQEEDNIEKMILNTTEFLYKKKNFELIIVDDHSSDRTKNIITRLKKSDDNIKFHFE